MYWSAGGSEGITVTTGGDGVSCGTVVVVAALTANDVAEEMGCCGSVKSDARGGRREASPSAPFCVSPI